MSLLLERMLIKNHIFGEKRKLPGLHRAQTECKVVISATIEVVLLATSCVYIQRQQSGVNHALKPHFQATL